MSLIEPDSDRSGTYHLGVSRTSTSIVGPRGADGRSLPPSTNQNRVFSLRSAINDSDGFGEELQTVSDSVSPLSDAMAPPRRRAVRAPQARALQSHDTVTSGSAPDDGVAWIRGGSPVDDACVTHLSFSAVPTRATVPLQLATWSTKQSAHPPASATSVPPPAMRSPCDRLQPTQQLSSAEFGTETVMPGQLSPIMPSHSAANELSAGQTHFYSPLAFGSDAHDATDRSAADRPSSQREACARRIHQLADTQLSLFSNRDAGSHLDQLSATPGSEDASRKSSRTRGGELPRITGAWWSGARVREADGAVLTPTAVRLSVGSQQAVSLGGVVLDAAPPPDLPPDPALKRKLPLEDPAVHPIHLSDSAARLTTSFMSLSTVTENNSGSAFALPARVQREGSTLPSNTLLRANNLLRLHLSNVAAGRTLTQNARRSHFRHASQMTADNEPNVLSLNKDVITPDALGPPTTQRRETMPLLATMLLSEMSCDRDTRIAQCASSASTTKLADTAARSTMPASDEGRFDHQDRESNDHGITTDSSQYLRAAREQRAHDRGASLNNHTMRSLEDEEVLLVHEASASRMARAEWASSAEIKLLLSRLPSRVTVPSAPNSASHTRSSRYEVVSDVRKQCVHLLDAQKRIDAEVARQLEVHKQLDALHGPIRYFPAL